MFICFCRRMSVECSKWSTMRYSKGIWWKSWMHACCWRLIWPKCTEFTVYLWRRVRLNMKTSKRMSMALYIVCLCLFTLSVHIYWIWSYNIVILQEVSVTGQLLPIKKSINLDICKVIMNYKLKCGWCVGLHWKSDQYTQHPHIY